MIKAVIFDFDGVLIDTFKAWYQVYNQTRKNFGFNEISKREFRNVAWARGWKNIKKIHFPGVKLSDIVTFSQDNYHKYLKNITLIDNPINILKKIKNKKIKIGLVTNTQSKILDLLMKKFHLNNCFDVIISANDVKKDKPLPDGILLCLKKLNVKNNELLYIGDTIYDKIAAKKAKVRFIGFRYGNDKINNLYSILKFL